LSPSSSSSSQSSKCSSSTRCHTNPDYIHTTKATLTYTGISARTRSRLVSFLSRLSRSPNAAAPSRTTQHVYKHHNNTINTHSTHTHTTHNIFLHSAHHTDAQYTYTQDTHPPKLGGGWGKKERERES
jgi:hypothetical protein